MKKDKMYKFYSDAGHGWMAVKKSELVELGIAEKISRCSYVKGNTVYLEEDGDCLCFFNAFEAKFGIPPRYETTFHKGSSPIRNYFHYQNNTLEGS